MRRSMAHRSFILLVTLAITFCSGIRTTQAQPVLEDSVLSLIKMEGQDNSQVMEIARLMTDVYGPRLTGSPQLEKASAWAIEKLAEWGVNESYLHEWGPFGRGWSLDEFSLRMVEPDAHVIHAYPKAWTSSTPGPVTAEVVVMDVKNVDDLDQYRGKLSGKIVLISPLQNVAPHFEAQATRNTPEDLLKLANAGTPKGAGGRHYSAEVIEAYLLKGLITSFLFSENPVAIIDAGWKGDLGTIAVAQATVPTGSVTDFRGRTNAWSTDIDVIPQVTVNHEDYNRLHRLASHDIPVKLELNLQAQFHTDDPMEHNVIAEIPGTDPTLGDEIVMIGAHYDSWHAGTGATDNAAGSAVMMETMRILKKVYEDLGHGPRRTIRLALWTGEEQGLYGSRAYVAERVAVPGETGQPPMSVGPEYDRISAYYNLDNGTGRIRGIYLQGNEALRPMFREWFAPFSDMEASTISAKNTTGTDHLSFDAVGVPGFQFIQDGIEYGPRTHHTNMDVFDRLVEDDLKQNATIMAAFVYNTSERDEMVSRKAFSAQMSDASGSE